MLDETILSVVKAYLDNLADNGVRVDFVVLYGSQAKGLANDDSDIDLLVVSPQFDKSVPRQLINILWRTAARTDSRIEPVACGTRQWQEDDGLPFIEMIRREWIKIA